MASDLLDVIGCRLLETGTPGIGEHGEGAPAVGGTAGAVDQPGPDEAVQASRETARREQEAIGELAHPHVSAFGFRKLDEHPVIRHRHPL